MLLISIFDALEFTKTAQGPAASVPYWNVIEDDLKSKLEIKESHQLFKKQLKSTF